MRTRINNQGIEVYYCRKCDGEILELEDVYQNECGEDVCGDCSLEDEE
jgi:hypothetical protein